MNIWASIFYAWTCENYDYGKITYSVNSTKIIFIDNNSPATGTDLSD